MSDVQKEAETLTANCTHGLEFAETAEHYADIRTRIRACIAYQIMERDEARKGYAIRPLQWVYNTNSKEWEARCVFGRISIYCTYTTAIWRLYLPGSQETVPSLEVGKERAWAWYVYELMLKVLEPKQ
jgi:hypothetical protein